MGWVGGFSANFLLYLGRVNKPSETASIPADDAGESKSDAEKRASKRGKKADDDAAAETTRERDRKLVERARKGDNAAFQELFSHYHRRAFSLAYGMVHNSDDALDIVQEAFIKAHRYLDKFEGTSSFYTWFYRIVTNLAIDHIRKHKRARHVDFNDAIAHIDGEGAAGEDSLLPRILGQNPGKALARKEVRKQIGQALEALSDNHRIVLVMRELEGLSYQEMAEIMKCSKGTIMSRLFHARRNMQKLLLEYMEGKKDLKVQ